MVQVGIQDVRRMGYLKIVKSFVPDILRFVREANMDAYEISCPAYSLPSKWDTLELDEWYIGMISFMHYCEPMIDNISVDSSSKDSAFIRRTFRNKWQSLGNSLAKDLGWSDGDVKTFLDYGIRICFIQRCQMSAILLRLYNAILIWFIHTQYESGIESLGYDIYKLLDDLCTWSAEEFLDKLIKEWR